MQFVAPLSYLVLVSTIPIATCAAHSKSEVASGEGHALALPAPGDPVPAPVDAEGDTMATEQGVASWQSSCPSAMILVDGDYCTEVRETCLQWDEPPEQTRFARCAKFAPSVCAGNRVHKRFCIDRDEYVREGDSLPLSNVSWTQARTICQKDGKRLCSESEWEFACEGEEMLPYPTGYERDSTVCNFDKTDLINPKTSKLRDLREPPAELDGCKSPFGVRSMTGNVDEWVWRDRTSGEWRSALKGGWWMPARDRCRPATTAHGENFGGLQTGFRCCADASPR
jgi:sulfatase modifying factor 1